MKKILLQLFIVSMSCWPIFSQSTTPAAISTSGEYFSVGGNSLSVTIGEMSAIETFSSANNFLTQGFQQPEVMGVGILTHQLNELEFVSFPNPARNNLTISFTASDPGRLKISVYDALGKETPDGLEEEIFTGEFSGSLSLSGLPSGLYFLHVQFQNSDGSISEAVRKIGIIQ